MATKSPKQIVTERFGDRTSLVAEIVKLTDGSDDERGRLMGTTNKKLLRIHEVATKVNDSFGGKSGLIDAIEKLQFIGGKSNAGWRTKVEKMTVKRLLDMHRKLSTRGPGAKSA